MQGPLIVAAIRPLTDLPLDTHLVSLKVVLIHADHSMYSWILLFSFRYLHFHVVLVTGNQAAAMKLSCVQMIVHPEERVADFAKAGSDIISVHAEPAATVHLDRTIQQVPAWQLYMAVTALSCRYD